MKLIGKVFDAASGAFVGIGKMEAEVGHTQRFAPDDEAEIVSLVQRVNTPFGTATVEAFAPKPEDWTKLIVSLETASTATIMAVTPTPEDRTKLIGAHERELPTTKKRSYPDAGDPHNRHGHGSQSKHFRARLQRAKNK